MKTIKTTIKTEMVYSDDLSKRYSLSITWDKQKKNAVIIMVSAGTSNGISFDHTTNHVLSNLYALDYGSVDIVNLFADLDTKKSHDTDKVNIDHIKSMLEKADTIIYATGTGYIYNKAFRKRHADIVDILESYKSKLMCIADNEGKKFYHPLCPKVREWNLVPFSISNIKEVYQMKIEV